MRRILAWALGTASMAALWSGGAHADNTVIASCGSLPNALPVGTVGNQYMDTNGNLCTNASGGGPTSTVAISQVTPGVTNAVNPVDQGGTSVTNSSSHSVNVTVLNNGVTAGTTAVGATYAPTATLTQSSCNGQTLTNAQLNPPTTDVKGNLCASVKPQVSAFVSGTASQTSSGVNTSLVSSVASQSLWIEAYSCSNSGSTTANVNFTDGSGGATLWSQIVPSGGGANLGTGMMPLFKTTAGNALFFTISASSTSVFCNAAGFSQ